ncbi:MAG: MFS transporter, partial [Gammaproteobacteria bacterium]
LSRFGYLRAFLISAVMMALAIVPIIWMGSLEAPTYAVVFGVTLNGIALPSFLTVTFQAARLKWASKSQAATDYTTQIVTMAAGSALATSIGGVVAHNLGWFWHFAIGGTATIAMCVTLYLLYEKVEAIVEARDRRELEATS